MKPIPKSGFYFPNRFAQITLLALEGTVGINGLHTILNLAHQPQLINNYPEPNLERQFDFADYSALLLALEEVYGARGGRSMAVQVGKAMFIEGLKDFGAMAGAGDEAFRLMPLDTRMEIGLKAVCRIFNEVSDQKTILTVQEEHYHVIVEISPYCWSRSGEPGPVCFIFNGLLQAASRWISGEKEFSVVEEKCMAKDDLVCEFVIHKTPKP